MGAGGLGFNYRAGAIRHGVATAATFLRSCVGQALVVEMDPTTRCMLRCNIASIIKI